MSNDMLYIDDLSSWLESNWKLYASYGLIRFHVSIGKELFKVTCDNIIVYSGSCKNKSVDVFNECYNNASKT